MQVGHGRLRSRRRRVRVPSAALRGKKGLRFVYPTKDGKQIQEYMHEGEKTLYGVEMTKSCQVTIEVTAI